MLRLCPGGLRNRYTCLLYRDTKNTNLTNLELSDNSAQEETSNYSYLAPNDKKTVRFSYTEVIEEFFEDNDCVDTSIAYGCTFTFFPIFKKKF